MKKRYTIYAGYKNGSVEEIDVDAKDRKDAIRKATIILNKAYMPGWRIVEVRHQTGLYF